MAKAAQIDGRRGGGKLNRSETVTVRLDPKLNYLCELAARQQRRTKSSFIEWAVELALKTVEVPGTNGWDETPKSISDLSATLWSVDEADRLLALAWYAPQLMDHEEQLLWRAIRGNGYLWRGQYIGTTNGNQETWTWEPTSQFLIEDRLRDAFDKIKAYVLGESNGSDLPTWARTRSVNAGKPGSTFKVDFDNLDDDVPF